MTSAVLLVAALLLAGPTTGGMPTASRPATASETPVEAAPEPSRPSEPAEALPAPTVPLPVPAAPVDAALDLRAGPVPTPMTLRMPTLGIDSAVLGVGVTPADAMDAPMGPADDPVWQQAFWYRGSAVPGTASTALIAGHVSAPGGRPGVFADIGALQAGDPVVVHDARSGLEVTFAVASTTTYALDDTTDPAVLARIYGAGPVAGTGPQASADGLAHLTLITCAGTFRDGTHDHRLVVHAVRMP